jgi:hypothetical protein
MEEVTALTASDAAEQIEAENGTVEIQSVVPASADDEPSADDAEDWEDEDDDDLWGV